MKRRGADHPDGHVAHGRFLLCGNRSSARVSGLTVAFDMLVAGFRRSEIPHVVIDKGAVGVATTVGAFAPVRALKTIGVVLRYWAALPFATTTYVTIAPSLMGFIRDACMIWPSRLLGRRIVLHMLGGGYGTFYDRRSPWLRRCIGTTLSLANAIVVEGRLLRDQFQFVDGIDDKLRVVPNGLPIDLDPTGVPTKTAPRSDEPVRLLYLSNMIASKGYLDVLEACRLLRQTWERPFTCDFCGAFMQTSVDDRIVSAAEAHEHFTRFVRENDLVDIVRFHGVVRGQRAALYRNAHLFLLPTSYPWEGQPISIIEALAFAMPVISTRYRGIPEQVIDGHTGHFVEPGDAVALAKTIREVMSDGEGYAHLSEQALAHYREGFTQDAHVGRLMATIMAA